MNGKVNKNNVETLYEYIIRDDQSLEGIQWEEISGCDYDTPESLMRSFIEIFLNTDFTEWVDYDHPEELIANREERKLALAQYFRTVADEIKKGSYDE